jgi:antitoxin (DNA-binding transcriptional repressor) of toxin-antitoxin stability system
VPWPRRREKRSRFAKATTRIAARSTFCAAGRTWSQDNSYCGGMNVRFSGILMKVRAGK